MLWNKNLSRHTSVSLILIVTKPTLACRPVYVIKLLRFQCLSLCEIQNPIVQAQLPGWIQKLLWVLRQRKNWKHYLHNQIRLATVFYDRIIAFSCPEIHWNVVLSVKGVHWRSGLRINWDMIWCNLLFRWRLLSFHTLWTLVFSPHRWSVFQNPFILDIPLLLLVRINSSKTALFFGLPKIIRCLTLATATLSQPHYFFFFFTYYDIWGSGKVGNHVVHRCFQFFTFHFSRKTFSNSCNPSGSLVHLQP